MKQFRQGTTALTGLAEADKKKWAGGEGNCLEGRVGSAIFYNKTTPKRVLERRRGRGLAAITCVCGHRLVRGEPLLQGERMWKARELPLSCRGFHHQRLWMYGY